MGLGTLLSAFADLVDRAIDVDAAQAGPDRVLRYHGGPTPDDCCTPDGVLSVWWKPTQLTVDFPVPLTFKAKPDGAMLLVHLHARWAICWPPPLDVDGGGVTPDDKACDAAAARLALVDEAVATALLRVSCATDASALAKEIGAETGCQLFRFVRADPNDMNRAGGCAAVEWECVAALAGFRPSTT